MADKITRAAMDKTDRLGGPDIPGWTYLDDDGLGVVNVLLPATGRPKLGIYIPTQSTGRIVCSLKNNDRAITWAVPPTWKGTNDPAITMPEPTDGYPLLIGNGCTVDQAYGDSMEVGEEQGCVIDCSKIPRGIFLVVSPTLEKFNVSLLIRAHTKS